MEFNGNPMAPQQAMVIVMEDNANFPAFLALYKFHFYGILYGRKLHFYALADA